MSEIPSDVMATAEAVCSEIYRTNADFPERLIARAILAERERATMAERERCAKVAKERFTPENVTRNKKGEPYLTSAAAIYAAGRIAFAIRSVK